MAHILLIEDDPILAKSLLFNISAEGHPVRWVSSFREARQELDHSRFDLAVLDIQLPDGNGIAFCKSLRSDGVSIPILLLTADAAETSTVRGLDAGANDYVKKPFSMNELMARIRALARLRSGTGEADAEVLEFSGLKVDRKERRVFYRDEDLRLNRTKLDILHFLIRHKQKVVSRDTLLRHLGKETEIFDRTIDAHISQIRRLLKDKQIDHLQITSIYGEGYRLEKV